MNYLKLDEESLKNQIREDYFSEYKCTTIGRIDFVIAKRTKNDDDLRSILWAEAKPGSRKDIYESFVQLILTIGKEKTFERYTPPAYVGAFDAKKMAFIDYSCIQEVFYQTDFNWNVTPSDHDSKEFKMLYSLCFEKLKETSIIFEYEFFSNELKKFISKNFRKFDSYSEKILVTRNNFPFVFQKWDNKVKKTINIDWDLVSKWGVISADFFLADLLSRENNSLKESLYVVLKKTKYELAKKIDDLGLENSSSVGFNDNQKAHKEFWSKYERPPKKEYWDFIVNRRDLLVPQDIRERKGSFFTPQVWVEKSQQYLAGVLGEEWQDEYYIWDCCAGTGNLLDGLTNYRNVFASTLDKQDVDVMIDRCRNGWNMFENHIFQFDFLKDPFLPQNAGGKIPDPLYEIIGNKTKRKKLVVYINPPYAEATNAKTVAGTGKNKSGVSNTNLMYLKYKPIIGKACNEIFSLFLIRISDELRGCKLGQFSKLKSLFASNFIDFRKSFNSKLESLFIVPANTFDNVKGDFPIGFFIWDTSEDLDLSCAIADVYDKNGQNKIGEKIIHIEDEKRTSINQWIKKLDISTQENVGYMENPTPDFQNNKFLCITNNKGTRHNNYSAINTKTIFINAVYFSVRHAIKPTWLNDRDQFLAPNNAWLNDDEFKTDCLIFTAFHGQNRISSSLGINHWIPFTEKQVNCKNAFDSNFLSNILNGKKKIIKEADLFDEVEFEKIVMSKEAMSVYNAGLELWKYYHSKRNINPNASYYDIRKFFKGETDGKMNILSEDEKYNKLISALRDKMKELAKKIEPKIYEYGFLK